MSHEQIMAQADRIIALGESAPRLGRDPVNQPMVNNWVEAMGDRHPAYVGDTDVHGGPVAPPAMVQVWTMQGLDPLRDPADPLYATMAMLDDAGYTSVVATDCEQTYDRYLRPGEQLTITTRLESVVGPKHTALGEGYFSTTRNIWRVGDEQVATMLFRILKFKPGERARAVEPADRVVEPADRVVEPVETLRPQTNRDTEFFWEGTRKGELRVQTCAACGALRHPPGPSCPVCHAHEREYVVASGRGTVYSYVVHRHPPVPGKQLPIVLVLVDLEEGVRMVGELLDADTDGAVEIGAAVEVAMVPLDDELTLPAWRLA
jgi:uncharacterized OB-fold protein